MIPQGSSVAEASRQVPAVLGVRPDAQVQGGAANDLLAGIAHQLEKALIHVDEPSFGQRRDADGDRAGMKCLRKTRFGLAQFFFRQFSFSHVAGVDDDGLDRGLIQQVGSSAFHPVP